MDARSAIGSLTLGLTTLCVGLWPARGEGPVSSVAQNANFVVTAPTKQLAADVLDRAEALRDQIALDWLGAKLPPSVGPALIHVRLSETEDKGLAWVADHPSRLSHIVWLTTTREQALRSALAHEMTHVVLATRYPGQLPAWANEGIAGLEDDAERQQIRTQILDWYVRTENWPNVRAVLAADAIARHDQAKYAVAVSLTEFLVDPQLRPQFVAFAVAGKRDGWEAALQHYYGMSDAAALQLAWQKWLIARSKQPPKIAAAHLSLNRAFAPSQE